MVLTPINCKINLGLTWCHLGLDIAFLSGTRAQIMGISRDFGGKKVLEKL